MHNVLADSDFEVAFHESAHALAALDSGLKVTKVELLNSTGLRGGVWHEPSIWRQRGPWSNQSNPDNNELIWDTWLAETLTPEDVNLLIAEAAVALAGPVAQFKRFAPSPTVDAALGLRGEYGWTADFAKFWPMAIRLTASRERPVDHDELLAKATLIRVPVVTRVWQWLAPAIIHDIEIIAKHLCESRRIDMNHELLHKRREDLAPFIGAV